jgi:ABC-2 type transport system ATP-binding protein
MSKGRLVADHAVSELLGLFRQEYYRIELGGRLPAGGNGHAPAWLAGFSVSEDAERGGTTLSGVIGDQDALHALLAQVRALGVPLVSVARAEPDLEEVFVKLVEGHKAGLPGQEDARE